ncbi:TetR/AcrR family transcriptional regulator [Mycobacterium sp. PDNC021]|uniref:TetR/AcrR family transcriptional regulator n=1 Tax=Mycobacterium sp. PDNC021 TaxID=3391399 RepID=UPI003AB0693C
MSTQSGPGRPRDASIDDRVLAATRELLSEGGFQQLSMRLVAQRSGVTRASLARRWPSKAALVIDAVMGTTPDLTPFAGTDVYGWIDFVVRGSRALFNHPDMKAAAPDLSLALLEDKEQGRSLWNRFTGPAVDLFADDVDAQTVDERRSAELDARAVLIMAAGAAMYVSTIAADDDSAELEERMVELLTAGYRAVSANRATTDQQP